MNFRELIKINPVRFCLFVIITVLTPITLIGNTALVQLETTIVLSRNLRNFIIISAISLVVAALGYVFIYISQYLITYQAQDLNNSVRDKIVKHYFYDGKKHQVSEMQNRLTNDLQMVNENYVGAIFNLLYGSVMIVSIIIYLIMLNWILLLTICLIVAITLVLPKLIEKPLQKANQLISDSNQVYLDTLNDWLAGLEQLRQFAAGAKLFSVSKLASKKLEDANVKQTTYTKLLNAITGIASAIFGLIIFLLSGFLVKNGLLEISALLIVGNFRFYLNQAINQISNARGQMKGIKKLVTEIDKSAEPVHSSSKDSSIAPAIIKTKSLGLKFSNGESLTYPDLQIKEGEKILLTGDSGAGKSTLFKLILGELKPSSGKIIFEDKNGNQIVPDLRKIGYLPQDPVVFPASILDNITMFNDKLDNKVAKAVKEVNLSADLKKFDEGIDKKLNLDKLNISGGQRQKIVLARTKVHDSDIILIDEGTSAIDQKATMDILNNLLKSKATIVFIAHNFNKKMHDLFDREIHLVKD
ncbi:ABC transporter, ATP-binding protein [Lactobacillus paragasseri JV-V03]|uniref:ABC transporter, ATP-binding protein n=1 Tax=Lactobacillus paragasseri JV-V03 TaxID=525326 RepID=A0AA87DEC0_9LACO|nr:ABC transporter ATP-binding protein [Lactobacillus paragasseri]EFJ70232.1 ABC transporter, ATP-binding protein [Lactobacillus paragasseri JV-V03]